MTPQDPSGSTDAPVTIGVLAVQGGVREHATALAAAGASTRLVRRPAELDGLDGLVVPGGESTTIDRLCRIFGLHEPIRDRIAEGRPVYGSCAGMIQLADEILDGHREQQTFGGIDMTVRRNAFGRQVDSFEADLEITGLSDPQRPFRAVFIRAPWVERLGEEVEVLASTDGHPVAVRQGGLLATSFHPEVSGDHRVHELFVQLVRAQRR
ncbi:Pyridoxine biosynthesis glutamine amidotransferase, glutaminase subunit [Serinicoccus hydrothermalis]|uniref:Pyridoxal 5'-phosphate synthase subunit PdxT n=1 Tax=Serinicoccus hydrothermalis TaxID=1758689 RepID=A0A1B1N8T4_9MICO|nr:pyridoxal 5'-phosphate synthase glutaminase subunit PdxT [Serinicoccus hydrothermalis]ANS77847.1 Pyridoxine biosynthesis glutamine amidotransferase, glutaminase subunit [Serinicoccus hydrothermalis]